MAMGEFTLDTIREIGVPHDFGREISEDVADTMLYARHAGAALALPRRHPCR